MSGTRRIQLTAGQSKLPKQPGELARFRVFHGPDSGAVFVITQLKATIGRGEDNDIVLGDLKASRRHAELSGVSGPAGIAWTVKDAGSANGLLHNGKVTRESALRLGDTVSLGETTLELADADAAPKGETQFGIERAALVRQIEKVRSLGSGSGSATAGSQSRPLLLLVGGAAVGFFLLMGGPSDRPASQSPAAGGTEALASRDLASFLPPGGAESMSGSAAAREAESFYRAGFREYRERNWLRARSQFETALQIQPGHRMAMLYLKNVETSIQDEVRRGMENGGRKLEAGKLREARTYFAAVLRLLYREPSHPDFSAAKDKIEQIDRDFAKSKGEGSS